jgi:transposase
MRSDVADAPVGREGGRRPSTLSTGHNGAGGATNGPLMPGQRWSVSRKREVVLRLLRGEAAEDLSRELGVPLYKLEHWRQKAEAALDGALKERETDAATGELATAMQRIGELSMEVELLRSRIERPGPCMGVRESSCFDQAKPSFEGFFVRSKEAVSSSRPSTEARRAQRRSILAEGHRRRRHAAVLTAASTAPRWLSRERFRAMRHHGEWIENEPRGARRGARELAPRPCIRLGPLGPGP